MGPQTLIMSDPASFAAAAGTGTRLTEGVVAGGLLDLRVICPETEPEEGLGVFAARFPPPDAFLCGETKDAVGGVRHIKNGTNDNKNTGNPK